jgi:hypothetical protein
VPVPMCARRSHRSWVADGKEYHHYVQSQILIRADGLTEGRLDAPTHIRSVKWSSPVKPATAGLHRSLPAPSRMPPQLRQGLTCTDMTIRVLRPHPPLVIRQTTARAGSARDRKQGTLPKSHAGWRVSTKHTQFNTMIRDKNKQNINKQNKN